MFGIFNSKSTECSRAEKLFEQAALRSAIERYFEKSGYSVSDYEFTGRLNIWASDQAILLSERVFGVPFEDLTLHQRIATMAITNQALHMLFYAGYTEAEQGTTKWLEAKELALCAAASAVMGMKDMDRPTQDELRNASYAANVWSMICREQKDTLFIVHRAWQELMWGMTPEDPPKDRLAMALLSIHRTLEQMSPTVKA